MATFDDYNYQHFRPKHVVEEAIGSWQLRGVKPGDAAPDFTLTDTEGVSWSVNAHRGRPVILHFGSYT